jgi:hypothetical protein
LFTRDEHSLRLDIVHDSEEELLSVRAQPLSIFDSLADFELVGKKIVKDYTRIEILRRIRSPLFIAEESCNLREIWNLSLTFDDFAHYVVSKLS